ncbi:MAG: GC-type dockerin domain-anchored protein [Phycisphaerales bacterium]|jgi:V8-like Glu-specific endopeptidase|nr:GC-type dockerin domain-anchored protein [Phycisphaerales bacterium]
MPVLDRTRRFDQSFVRPLAGLLTACAMLTAPAFAQPEAPAAPGLPSESVALDIDSGWVEPGEVFDTLVDVPNAAWLRLAFDDAVLPTLEGGQGCSIVTIESMRDGAVQTLSAVSLRHWQDTSAYFNGDQLIVRVYAEGAPARVRIVGATAGFDLPEARSICGTADNRTQSNDPRSARFLPAVCTAWIIGDVDLLSAGHCVEDNAVVEFNVPPSTSSGVIVHPHPDDQYPIDPASMQSPVPYSYGNDWAYFGAFPNSNTGLTPLQAQGEAYTLAPPGAWQAGDTIRVAGYGTTYAPTPREWNYTQTTHTGRLVEDRDAVLLYDVDTTGGNSGSAIFDQTRGVVIGIHTNAGCNSAGGNAGTSMRNIALWNALANPLGVSNTCPADWDRSGGAPNSSDFLAFLNDFTARKPGADIAPEGGDSDWDSDDLLHFLNTWAAGC